MKALIREHNQIKEVMTEPFIPWVCSNMDYLINVDGWTLVEDYTPEEES